MDHNAWNKGFVAWWEKEPPDNNPYLLGTEAYTEWHNAWRGCNRHYLMFKRDCEKDNNTNER